MILDPIPLGPARPVRASDLARPLAVTALAAIAFVLVVRLAASATLPGWTASLLAPASLLGLVVAAFRAAVALGAVSERPLFRRHGLAVVAVGTCVALPMLGAFTLVDPWETHYAEVAREMIERRDFVSPWWAHEGWFMSKPVLTFWLEAASMVLFGVHTGPDAVIAGGARPEWAVRLPAFALALVASYVLYNGVSRTCGRRAGLIGAIALWTCPGYALLSHQAITDMPLVACIAASLGLLLRALATGDEVHVARYAIHFGRRTLVVHAGHGLAALVVLAAAPQLVFFALEHVRVTGSGLAFGADHFASGSPHACGLPGQPACAAMAYAHPRLQPFLLASLFLPLVAWLAARIGEETRVARLFAIGAWGFAAIATMAKGPAGLVVPAAAALIAIAHGRSLRPLLRVEIFVGLVLTVALVAPWYLAVYARHGRMFIDELVMRHMLGRTLDHLHDTNEGEDVGVTYFVKQLGYATFPWCGLFAAAALTFPSHDDRSKRSRARALLFGATLFSFALVSAMRTKFHHYVLIALPPSAMLVGLFVDERLGQAESPRRATARNRTTAALAIGAACVALLVTRDLASSGGPLRLVELLTYRYARRWPSAEAFAPAIAAFGVAGTLGTLALAARRWRRHATAAMGVCAFAFAAFLLDAYLVRTAPDGGQREVIAAFYRARDTRPTTAPLVAYQLNWKGENFYTGNRLAIFVSSGPSMKTWLDTRRREGERTFYFVTEHGRVVSLRSELGHVRAFEKLTDEHVSAEFCVVRVEMDAT